MTETYIPNARDATIAYFGLTSYGLHRARCVACSDSEPLAGAHKVRGMHGGSMYVSHADHGGCSRCPCPGHLDEGETCDACGVTLASLSEQCQREHDEQQARWARIPVQTIDGQAVRCRIY